MNALRTGRRGAPARAGRWLVAAVPALLAFSAGPFRLGQADEGPSAGPRPGGAVPTVEAAPTGAADSARRGQSIRLLAERARHMAAAGDAVPESLLAGLFDALARDREEHVRMAAFAALRELQHAGALPAGWSGSPLVPPRIADCAGSLELAQLLSLAGDPARAAEVRQAHLAALGRARPMEREPAVAAVFDLYLRSRGSDARAAEELLAPLLECMVSDPGYWVRSAALERLSVLAERGELPRHLLDARWVPDQPLTGVGAYELARLLALDTRRPLSAPVIDAHVSALRHPSAYLRGQALDAIVALYRRHPGDPALPTERVERELRRMLLGDADGPTRRSAFRSLGRILNLAPGGLDDLVNELADNLAHPEEDRRLRAAGYLQALVARCDLARATDEEGLLVPALPLADAPADVGEAPLATLLRVIVPPLAFADVRFPPDPELGFQSVGRLNEAQVERVKRTVREAAASGAAAIAPRHEGDQPR